MILVDTSFFFAFFASNDEDHDRAVAALDEFEGRLLPEILVTTDIIVIETITLARRRASHKAAAYIGEHLYSEKLAHIYRTSFEEHRAAFEYFKRYDDKKYSAVDCLSFIVMEKLELAEALTLDADFSHRFTVRPGLL